MPLPPSPPAALLLPSPFAALHHPLRAHHPSSQIASSASAPAPFRLPRGFPGTAAFSPENPQRRFHPRHSGRRPIPPPSPSLPSPDPVPAPTAYLPFRHQA